MSADGETLFAARGLGKAYAAPVLQDFDFDLQRGEVHALVGANGAGKSTFVRAVSGLTPPDTGTMSLAGRPHAPRNRREAERAGVVIVLQELNVIPTLTVAENILFDRLPQRGGWVDRTALRERAGAALRRVGLPDIDPDLPAGELGIGEQQLVEIAAALDRDCRLLILDEPTAALTAPEIDRLFDHVRSLQRDGVGVIYITHRMDELPRLATRVSVLRDGRRISTRETAAATPAVLLRDMAGLEAGDATAPRRTPPGATALRVVNLHAGNRVQGVNLTLRRGEILGLAGLVGAGRTETLRAIFGADPVSAGEVFLGDATQPLRLRGPHDAVRHGLGLIPEDRKKEGLLLTLGSSANAGLATIARRAPARTWVDRETEYHATGAVLTTVELQCAHLDQPVAELSGGNQQKVVVARWLLRDCAILLIDEPTRGVDIAAKHRVHALLRALAAEGKALLVVSSELSELTTLCDRIAVLSAGRVAAEFAAGEWSEAALLQASFRHYLHPTPAASAP